jgi:hypothetical protein
MAALTHPRYAHRRTRTYGWPRAETAEQVSTAASPATLAIAAANSAMWHVIKRREVEPAHNFRPTGPVVGLVTFRLLDKRYARAGKPRI